MAYLEMDELSKLLGSNKILRFPGYMRIDFLSPLHCASMADTQSSGVPFMDCPLARVPLEMRQMIYKLLFDNRAIHVWSENVLSELEITNPEVAFGVREPVTDERGPLSYSVCDTDLLFPESYWVYHQRTLVYSNSDVERTCTVRDVGRHDLIDLFPDHNIEPAASNGVHESSRRREPLARRFKTEEAEDSAFVDLAFHSTCGQKYYEGRDILYSTNTFAFNDHISFANFLRCRAGLWGVGQA